MFAYAKPKFTIKKNTIDKLNYPRPKGDQIDINQNSNAQNHNENKIHQMIIPSVQIKQYLNNKHLYHTFTLKKNSNMKTNMQVVLKLKRLAQNSERYNQESPQQKININATSNQMQKKLRKSQEDGNSSIQKIKSLHNKFFFEYLKNNPEIEKYFKRQLNPKEQKIIRREIEQNNKKNCDLSIGTPNQSYDDRILRTRLNRQTRLRKTKRQYQQFEKKLNTKENSTYFQARSIQLIQSKKQSKKRQTTKTNQLKNLLNRSIKSDNYQRRIEYKAPIVLMITPKVFPQLPHTADRFQYLKLNKRQVKSSLDKRIPICVQNSTMIEQKISGWEKEDQKNEQFYNSYL